MASGPFFARKAAPIGIQLYTLSDMLATNLEGAISGVAKIGYKTVEIPSYMGKTPAQLREICSTATASKCTGAHIGMNAGTDAAPGLRGDLDKLAADMHVLGVTHVYAPSMAIPTDIGLTQQANEGYAYHRARRRSDGRGSLEASRRRTDGHRPQAEGQRHRVRLSQPQFRVRQSRRLARAMTSWSPRATRHSSRSNSMSAGPPPPGNDIPALFAKYSGRYSGMHMKDMKASTVAEHHLKMDPTEVGSGKLDWKTILPAAMRRASGTSSSSRNRLLKRRRMEAAEIGYKYLSTLEA